ncbi:helix-turn-helix transcriptional regulator [Flavobacterium sp. WC2421]|uniref:helix-turn-helix domain-containing protein n=1 Tax=Flavobacterium sp. WC2421 TaxID=3234138 RepID=UPI003467D679
MKTNKKARVYNSPIVESILSNISKEELDITEGKMRLAIKIAEAIRTTGLNKSQFAKKINKNNSEISKWLSGTHNFTTDTLLLLESELPIKLVDSEINETIALKNLHLEVVSTKESKINFNFLSLFDFSKPDYTNSYSLTV